MRWLLTKNKLKEADDNTKRQKAAAIMARGGPKTLEETLLLFPGACSNCGCRSFEVTEYITWHGDRSANNNPDETLVTVTRCQHCDRAENSYSNYSYGPVSGEKKMFLVRSPLLSDDQQNGLEFPFSN